MDGCKSLLATLVNVHDVLIEAEFIAQCIAIVPKISTTSTFSPLMVRVGGWPSVFGQAKEQ